MSKIVKSDQDWRAQLSDLAYEVTRRHATERPFSHDDFPEGEGLYTCTCCGAPLFTSEDRYDSGCGWPAFTAPVGAESVGDSRDTSHGMIRTEVHCSRCDAHLGHVFPDGPPDRGGLRYCINGVALDFDRQDD
ncbi:peptide-methionine (R)-S-oxide reductase MsrB [Pseudogemmobacter bohemicus]|uniref:peptide-methionine (R)-S-oxide reductase MsrB n=1 Tax=Pseudogemmobacter bohemicus TaxID=2250708 RepID=UPI000DD430BD|nr:peptide-methionine (R)-S-oxide reductase MsrB [Pseudogemmobacter bohemicus]